MIGMNVADARRFIADFIGLVRGEKSLTPDELGDLAALEGVKDYPMRVKCATMSWHAMQAALDKLGAR